MHTRLNSIGGEVVFNFFQKLEFVFFYLSCVSLEQHNLMLQFLVPAVMCLTGQKGVLASLCVL